MKHTLIMTIAAAIFASSAFARIGETEAQIEKRYGAAKFTKNDTERGYIARAYLFGEFDVLVTYERGVSTSEQYSKSNGTPLLQDEVNALLQANSDGKKWRELGRDVTGPAYRSDGGRIADLNNIGRYLLVAAPGFVDRVNARHDRSMKEKF